MAMLLLAAPLAICISLDLALVCSTAAFPLARSLPSPRSPPRAPPLLAQESGKFSRHADLSPGCSPLGVLCAGFDADQLELLAEAIDSTFADADGESSRHVPIVALDQADLSRSVQLQATQLLPCPPHVLS